MDVEYKYCLRCGRRLKTDEARQRGFGKVCYEKAHSEKLNNKLFGGLNAKGNTSVHK